MSGAALGVTVIVYSLGVAVVCAVAAVRVRPRPAPIGVALVILELAVIGQAVIDAGAVLAGQHGPDVATHVGYLVASVLVVPVTIAAVRGDPGRWGSAALVVGCLVLAVVSLRLHQTLGTTRA